LALAFAAGMLLVLAAGNVSRLGLERTLAKERSRARVDALTDAPNRHALAEALTAEQARIRRGARTGAICFLDLDRFKTVNDTYGYAAGDRLLVDVYQRLHEQLRASDQVFRWGGEEFVVLAPHVEGPELADFAERLRLLIATRPFSIDGKPRTITGSVGAVLLEESRPAEAALEAAGRLVRKAKLTRNTAVVDRTPPGDAFEIRAAS
jgi:diguanylate cyclase (GGDEF)-like protein